VDNQIEFRRSQGFVRKYLPYLPAHWRKNLAQDISLFLAEVFWVSDKYTNQWQISIDEGYLRFHAFQQPGAQIPGCALSNWHTRSFFQKQAVHNRG
jgi:hypothetical protein